MAWLKQDHRAKKNLGDNAPWCVEWIDPDGKRRFKKIGCRSRAEKFAKKIEAELIEGTYNRCARKSLSEFRAKYETEILAGKQPGTIRVEKDALNHFERITGIKRVDAITTVRIDEYIAKRRKERGRKKASTVSLASIGKELRCIKAVLGIAHEWGYLPKMPRVKMPKPPKKLPRFVTPEHFGAIYLACDKAELPSGVPFPVADWWKGLLTFQYMTGWRIGEVLALRREDVDLEAATAITRHEDNKGHREECMPLHPVVVEHLRRLASFDPFVFPWPHNEKSLYLRFRRLQEAAGVHLTCRGEHKHTPFCHVYSFHDLRRAFATQNAPRLTGFALQALMRHEDPQTTRQYINVASQLQQSVEALHVPPVLAAGTAG